MPRPYNKKSPYWSNLSKKSLSSETPSKPAEPQLALAAWDDNPHYSAIASCGGGGSSYRDGFSGSIAPLDRYKNINAGILPWENRNGLIGMRTIIETCQRAYANVSIVRNVVESCVEFTTTPLHFKTSNQTVKSFFNEWWNRIRGASLAQQFAREYYRSGNVPIYKFYGTLSKEQYGLMKATFGARSDQLPIKYTILNPAQVYLNGGIGYGQNWVKILSTYEVERLRKQATPEDKQVFNSLPIEVKQSIMKGASYNEILIPLNPQNLNFVFYKKQDYEPMAIPMIFPVLNDIEWKLELKKMDMSLARTIEQVILVVNVGEKRDQHNPPYNFRDAILNLQGLFSNQTLGRVLLGDHTLQANWKIPEISEILGPAKYTQVEKDIKEGLQSILTGDGEKFANAQIKTKVFIERMKEAQKVFLNEFLIPEAQEICKSMGFKNLPEIEFEEIRLDDPNVAARTYLRLAELGILTPEELFTAINSGILPDIESNIIKQNLWKEQRDKGLYMPMLGGSNQQDGGDGRPVGTKAPQSKKTVSPIGTKASVNGDKFSMTKVASLNIMADKLMGDVKGALKKHYKVKGELNEAQASLAETLGKQIMINEDYEKWSDSTLIKEYVKTPKMASAELTREIDRIAAEYEESEFNAILLSKAKIV